jgi:hypothetical protein
VVQAAALCAFVGDAGPHRRAHRCRARLLRRLALHGGPHVRPLHHRMHAVVVQRSKSVAHLGGVWRAVRAEDRASESPLWLAASPLPLHRHTARGLPLCLACTCDEPS